MMVALMVRCGYTSDDGDSCDGDGSNGTDIDDDGGGDDKDDGGDDDKDDDGDDNGGDEGDGRNGEGGISSNLYSLYQTLSSFKINPMVPSPVALILGIEFIGPGGKIDI